MKNTLMIAGLAVGVYVIAYNGTKLVNKAVDKGVEAINKAYVHKKFGKDAVYVKAYVI